MAMRQTARPDTRDRKPRSAGRRGSTLIIVLALLGALMLLGFLFFTIASQEQENAHLFSEAAKDVRYPDDYFNFALEALIVGPRDDYYNSALWGGRSSLLATMFGNDLQPFNGSGINLAWNALSAPGSTVLDQNYDGTGDPAASYTPLLALGSNYNLTDLNLSPSAQGASIISAADPTMTGGAGLSLLPAPDAEYTYPDLNSPFLSFVSTTPSGRRVVIPSFHRPQYLRDFRTVGGIAENQFYRDAATRTRVMRPHAEHLAIRLNGTAAGDRRRYITSATDDDARDFGGAAGVGPEDLFPIDLTPVSNPATEFGPEGLWSAANPTDVTTKTSVHNYDRNVDGDDISESVLIDLDHPPQLIADRLVVPLYAITIQDADALFNLNAHGNAYGNITLGTAAFGGGLTATDGISRSNQASGPHEVNLTVGLTPDLSSASATDFAQHEAFFGHVPDLTQPYELANMEWWFTLVGRAEFSAAGPSTYYIGRWGEVNRLRQGVDSVVAGTPNSTFFPYPGFSEKDDDFDAAAGLGASPGSSSVLDPQGRVFPPAIVAPPSRHPIDYRGQGRTTTASAGGRDRVFYIPAAATGAVFRFPRYLNYIVQNAPAPFTNTTWQNFVAPGPVQLVQAATWAASYSVGGIGNYLLTDHPNETVLDPSQPSAGQDAVFAPVENAALHLRGNDLNQVKSIQRLLTLVPYNFGTASNNADIRSRYTTTSSDLKTFGQPVPNAAAFTSGDNRHRPWEVSRGATPVAFPPLFPNVAGGQRQPFRDEVRRLLENEPGEATQLGLMRKLSVNHIAERVTRPVAQDPASGRMRLRPLTPHPLTGLTSTPVGNPPGVVSFGVADTAVPAGWRTWDMTTAAQQEWNARRDRQNLAADIYALLYTMSGVSPVDPRSTPAATVHPDPVPGTAGVNERIREMAQFAVNLVDAMDEDDVMTCFVYDSDLSDGYTLTDNGYSNPVAFDSTNGVYQEAGRGMVFGVERQQLAINEAAFVVAPPTSDDSEHILTEWDDSANDGVEDHEWAFIELANPNPDDVSFANDAWQVVLKPAGVGVTGALERRLIITGGPGARVPGTMNATAASPPTFVIAAAGDTANTTRPDPLTSPPAYNPNPPTNLWTDLAGPSRIRVQPKRTKAEVQTAGDYGEFVQVLPFYRSDLDLLRQADIGRYRIHEPAADPYAPNDGVELNPTALDAGTKGSAFVEFGGAVNAGNFFVVELRRRLNPHRLVDDPTDLTKSQDNPWVVVDRMSSTRLQQLTIDPGDDNNGLGTGGAFFDKLVGGTGGNGSASPLRGNERKQPLNAEAHSVPPIPLPGTGYPNFVRNTLGGWRGNDPNTDTAGALPGTAPAAGQMLWQPHYDRPFASLGELLGVPLYGPDSLTSRLGTKAGVLRRQNVAAGRVLFPDLTIAPPDSFTSGQYPNLWYRIFEYLEVPAANGGGQNLAVNPWFTLDGGPTAIDDPQGLGRYRRFGKLNLNTLRHPHVMAGMLDDFEVFQHPAVAPLLPTANGEMLDGGTIAREWWTHFVLSRDGQDPVTQEILPGLPVGRTLGVGGPVTGRPFRSTGMAIRGSAGTLSPTQCLDDTIFRRLPASSTALAGNQRGLFELGTAATSATPLADTATFDYTTRYRLLSKAINHSTTRSNVFLVSVQVEFFRAVVGDNATPGQVSDDVASETADPFDDFVRIAGRDDQSPTYRAFFVIDRTKALELLRPGHLPQSNQWVAAPRTGQSPLVTSSFARNSDGTSTFDWRQLVISRVRLQ